MEPRTLSTYGAPYVDGEVVQNPETQVGSDDFNRLCEDVAQMTRTSLRAAVRWLTIGTVDDVPSSQVWHKSLWGTGDLTKPTVSRTGAGLYTVTYDSSFNDGLGEAETVAFWDGHVSCRSGNAADDFAGSGVLTVSGSTITTILREGGSPADQGAGPAYFYATLWLL